MQVKDLQPGKLYRLKQEMSMGAGNSGRFLNFALFPQGMILMFVEASAFRQIGEDRMLTFLLTTGEVHKQLFAERRIGQFLQLCQK